MRKKIRITNALPLQQMPCNLKAYNIAEPGEDSAEITMYGEVVESQPIDWWTGEPVNGMFIILSDFLSDIENLKSKNSITVRINSPGGDLEAGVSIYNRLKEMNNVTTIVDGLAASAASLIAQAGDTRKVYKSSQLMAHGASVGMFGSYNLQELNGVRDMLEAANKQVMAIYEETTGQSKAKIKHLVENTTWLTGQEIIDNGFADEVIAENDVTMSLSADKSLFYCNNIAFRSNRMASLPKNIKVQTGKPADINNNPEGGKAEMTREELQNQYPELVKAIEDAAVANSNAATNEAIEAERKRIEDIESIEDSIADKKLVKNAKFGDKTMDARELAFKAMQESAKLGNDFLKNNAEDLNKSGAHNIGGEPNSGGTGKDDQKAKDEADIKAAVDVINQIGGKK